MSESER
jgi:hypothetical protein